MFHSCHIKFGAVTNLTDARYAAAVYAKWTGFCLDPENPRYVSPLKVKEIAGWIAGTEIVAEIGSLLPGDMATALEVLDIKTVQVNTSEAAEQWASMGYEVILEGRNGGDEFIALSSINTGKGNAIVDVTEWSMEQIKELAANPPYAINLNGGDESAPGIRDFDEVDEILSLFEL